MSQSSGVVLANIAQSIIRILVIISQKLEDNGETSLVFHFLHLSVQKVFELIRVVRFESDDNSHGFDILVEVSSLVRQLGHPVGDFGPVVGQDVFRGFDEVDDVKGFFGVSGFESVGGSSVFHDDTRKSVAG